MSYLPSFLFALLLCVSSAGLIVWHIRAGKRMADAEIDARELNFRRRQYRRRIQTSAMLGILGAAIFVGQLLIAWPASRLVLVIYWSGVLVLLLWLVLLAVADMAATSFFYSREKTNFVVEQARLRAELQRAQNAEATAKNGKPK